VARGMDEGLPERAVGDQQDADHGRHLTIGWRFHRPKEPVP
jgi:hypothetical protein